MPPTEVLLGWRDEERVVELFLVPAVGVRFDHAPELVHVALAQGLGVRAARDVVHDVVQRAHDAPPGVLGHPLGRQCYKKGQLPMPRLLEKGM